MGKLILEALLLLTLSALFLSLPTMWLWNSLMPNLFQLPSITFWQALGLCLLARFVFGTGSSGSKK